MHSFYEISDIHPYSLKRSEKEQFLNSRLSALCRHHYHHCDSYRKMMDAIGFDVFQHYHYSEIPFLPVRLFKMFDLYSVPEQEIIKTITSSGTTGQSVSKIFLDRNTSANQTKALAKIVSSFIGTQRMPMIIIDSESVLKDRNLFSARGAGIMGFSLFGNQKIFALNDRMELNIEKLHSFSEQHKGQRILIFGFTYIIYQHFIKELLKINERLDWSDAILFHGGGWKKLSDECVSPEKFWENLHDSCGITSIHDYYGMAEQAGSIFVECEYGCLHSSVYSDVIIRRTHDFSEACLGEKGIIQVLSILPQSYPGHSLLTEDEGIILGEDDCPCGRMGKYLKITGRLKNAEIRGCSDTFTR